VRAEKFRRYGPVDTPGCEGRRNCNVNLDDLLRDRPDLGANPSKRGASLAVFNWTRRGCCCCELWWSATTGGHVGFESWLEHVLHLDFDPSVVGIASHPFWLHWTDAIAASLS
jgi:hypothetical protein